MEKKHISIIGSCVSREMFNSSLLKEMFCVDGYAFKVCVWDLFGESLEFKKDDFEKIEMPSFYSRMLWYGFNKVTLSEIEKFDSEYLLVDFLNIKHLVDKITYNDKSVFIQDMHNSFATYKDKVKGVSPFNNLTHERLSINDISTQTVLNGIERFAEWAKKHFDESKIIINNFATAKGYYTLSNQWSEYTEAQINDAGYEECEKYARMFKNMIPGAIFLDKVPNLVSQHALYDGVSSDIPSMVHFTNESYVRLGENLINKLNIKAEDYFSLPISPLGYECCMLKNAHIKLNAEYKELRSNSLSLSAYLNKFSKPEDFIFVFTSKDGVVFHTAFQRAMLPLACVSVPKANKFSAIISKSHGIANYKTSPNQIVISEKIEAVNLSVFSMGWGSTSSSRVEVFGEEKREYTFEKAGVNILVLNSKNFEVVDRAHCNTDTADLIVVSEYVLKSKITI